MVESSLQTAVPVSRGLATTANGSLAGAAMAILSGLLAYAAGSAVVTARLYRHAVDPDTFQSWLDYVDTYLAIWVMGYPKDPNLVTRLVSPPGFDLPPA